MCNAIYGVIDATLLVLSPAVSLPLLESLTLLISRLSGIRRRRQLRRQPVASYGDRYRTLSDDSPRYVNPAALSATDAEIAGAAGRCCMLKLRVLLT
jgi:hypothetical protein